MVDFLNNAGARANNSSAKVKNADNFLPIPKITKVEKLEDTDADILPNIILPEPKIAKKIIVQLSKLVPNLRFPQFVEEWEEAKLSELVNYTKGYAFKSEDYQNTGIRIIRVSDLGVNSLKYDNEKIYISFDKTVNLEKYKINQYDIIITTVGSKPELIASSVGRGILILKSNEGLLNQNLLKINASDAVNNCFLFGYINTKRYISHITEIQRGNANQSNITINDLFEYKITIPSLAEQTQIGNFLTAVDTRISLLKQKLELLKSYKKGIMAQIFSQELRFKDENGQEFPEWEEKTLGEVAQVIVGGTPSTTIPEYWNGTIGWIGSGELKNGIIKKPTKYITELGLKKGSTFLMPKETAVLAMTGATIGKVGLLNFDCTGNQSVAGFINLKNLNSVFLFYQLQTMMTQIIGLSGGAAQIGINKSSIEKLIISLPCLAEQTKIAEFLTAIDKKINLTEQQIAQSEEWKKGLLQQMLV